MKTIGICIPTIEGGVVCHQEIGREATRRGVAYPAIATHTPLFEEIGRAVQTSDFNSLAAVLSDSINRIAKAGADVAIISANTMHIVFDEIAAQSQIPILSILEVTAEYCTKHGYQRVGVLGTTPTITRRIFDAPLEKRGMTTVYLSQSDQDVVMDIIHNELIRGIFLDPSRQQLERIAKQLATQCDAIILGCTELPLVLTEESCQTKFVDTTRVLAHAALDHAHE
ncbi:Aspartate racemase [Penicillium alfredii]|uniref:Aspartate racemase n=1 Tax=Penicillium alfredii TaxID=1506179 RepID=A0A9W9F0C6_9EURO|nr:Aspartate racemase [Penicillium alfredii]KAJ5091226.1 Aspartate racemase [Penicillium alfredii]